MGTTDVKSGFKYNISSVHVPKITLGCIIPGLLLSARYTPLTRGWWLFPV